MIWSNLGSTMKEIIVLSKHTCLLKLASAQNRNWVDLLNAWNALYEFLQPILQHRFQYLQGKNSNRILRKWRCKLGFPSKQVSSLNLSTNEINTLMRSVCYRIMSIELEPNQYGTNSLPTTPEVNVNASNDNLQIVPSPNLDRNRAEPRTRLASLSKKQCFRYLAGSHDRKWDDFINAWNAMEEFIGPRLESRASNLPSHERLQQWRNQPGYPSEQVSPLNLSTGEANLMMRSVCSHVASMEQEQEQAPDETVTLPEKRERDDDDDALDHDVEIISSPASIPKRARTDQKMKALPLTTKIYFMEEDNQDSRIGIMVTLLTSAKPNDGHIDIKTLRYGNATRHLAKRSNFDKNRHQIFYYDLENPRVRINVDSVASFRAAVEEMSLYRELEPRVEFCFSTTNGPTRLV
jgi:hypothetical protein